MQSVLWSSCQRLSCSSASSPTVVICLNDTGVVASPVCPDATAEPFEFTTLEATLVKVWRDSQGCCNPQYRYLLQYDETDLVDPTTLLVTADIANVFCKGCLTTWVEEKVGNEVVVETDDFGAQVLISEHGCEYPLQVSSGVCVVSVTLAALNALISGNSLTAGCIYVVTDFVQGRLVAGTKVIFQALSASSLSIAVTVMSTYDTKGWPGVWSFALNKLEELKDNRNNLVIDTFNTYDAIGIFDWGNPHIDNCSVINSWWLQTIGSTHTRQDVLITDYSEVDTTAANRSFIELKIIQSEVTVHAEVALSNSIVSGESTVEIGCSAPATRYSLMFIHNSEIFAPNTGIGTADNLNLVNGSYFQIADGKTFDIDNLSLDKGDLEVEQNTTFLRDITMTTSSSFFVQGGSVQKVIVEMGTLTSGGFDMNGVYLRGVFTETLTGANTNTGKDLFNDSLV